MVRARRDELVDQITLGPHDLDAVIAGLLRQGCAPDEVLDRPLDLLGRELVGHEGRDRGLDRARADEIAMVGVAPEVQDLQADPPPLGVDRVGDHAVLGGLLGCGERGSTLERTALVVGGDPAGHDEADAAAGAFGIEGRHPLETVRCLLQPDVHRAHEHPVGECREAQVEGG